MVLFFGKKIKRKNFISLKEKVKQNSVNVKQNSA